MDTHIINITVLRGSKWESEPKHMEYGIELISQHCQFMLGICELDIEKEKS